MAGRPRLFDDDRAIDAAVDLFWRRGYATTTPQELAAALNIAKGSLYNAFRSKANLFALALERYNERRIDALTAELSAPAPSAECLLAAASMLAGIGAHRNGCFATNSVVELAGAEVAGAAGEVTTSAAPQRLFAHVEEAFAECIRRGQRNGELVDDRDPEQSASVLLATVIGVSVLARSGRDHDVLTGILRGAVRALERAANASGHD